MTRLITSAALLALVLQAPAPWKYPPTKTGRRVRHVLRQDLQGPVPLAGEPQGQGRRGVVQGAGRADRRTLLREDSRRATRSPTEWMALDKLQARQLLADPLRERPRLLQEDARRRERRQALLSATAGTGTEKLLFDPATFTPKDAKPGDVTTIVSSRRRLTASTSCSASRPPAPSTPRCACSTSTARKLLPETMYPSYGRARLDAGQHVVLLRHGQGHRHQEPRDRAQPQDPPPQARRATSRLTSTSSATRATPTSASPRRNFRRRSSTNRIPTTSSAASAPCRTRCASSTRRSPQMKDGAQARLEGALQAHPTTSSAASRSTKTTSTRVTHAGAPQYKVVRTSLDHPDWATRRDGRCRRPRTRSSTSPRARASCSSSTPTGSSAASSSTTSPRARPPSSSCPPRAPSTSAAPTCEADQCIVVHHVVDPADDALRLRREQGHLRQEHLQHRRRLSRLREPRHRGGRGAGPRRHDGSALDHPPQGPEARRQLAPRSSKATAPTASATRRASTCGTRRAARRRARVSPTSAAAARRARPGTRPATRRPSRTRGRTSSRAPST